MTERVYIPDVDEYGVIVSMMAYGAIVKYNSGGFEFQEMLADEDFMVIDDE